MLKSTPRGTRPDLRRATRQLAVVVILAAVGAFFLASGADPPRSSRRLGNQRESSRAAPCSPRDARRPRKCGLRHCPGAAVLGNPRPRRQPDPTVVRRDSPVAAELPGPDRGRHVRRGLERPRHAGRSPHRGFAGSQGWNLEGICRGISRALLSGAPFRRVCPTTRSLPELQQRPESLLTGCQCDRARRRRPRRDVAGLCPVRTGRQARRPRYRSERGRSVAGGDIRASAWGSPFHGGHGVHGHLRRGPPGLVALQSRLHRRLWRSRDPGFGLRHAIRPL